MKLTSAFRTSQCRRFASIAAGLVICVALLVPAGYSDNSFQKRWDETLEMVRQDFPHVRQISTAMLATLIEDGADMALLDTREPEEYQVSHIKGAVLARNFRRALDALRARSRDELVVVYCSVGYRSSEIAAKLARRGFTNVVNVEGSIFKWANEKRPLHKGSETAAEVHPYDDEWGTLLDPQYLP